MTAIDRRAFLTTTAAAALSGPALAQASGEDQKLRVLLDAIYEENLAASPEAVTRLGLDKGARAAAKSKLDGSSAADIAEDRARNAAQLKRLEAIDGAKLSPRSRSDWETVLFTARTNAEGTRFGYGDAFGQEPYVVSQLNGAYRDKPDFLGTQHTIETRADADAYLSRLEAYAQVMDQETERARADAGRGVVPPDFIIAKALTQMRALKVDPATSPLVRSVADRAKEKGLAGEWEARAAGIYSGKVVPALDRQIALFEGLQPKATHEAGCWRLPEGEAFYRHALKNMTTTTLSADEVHQLGLETAKSLSARADTILKAQGYSKGTVGERIAALFKEPKYLYPNTDEAKERLIADLNKYVDAIRPRLPEAFGQLPKAPVEIRRVPKFIEAGAPGGYYNRPALDGSRPGIYWINLRDSAENPTWTLKTLTYHESIPGHHLQRTLQQEGDAPMLRRTAGFPAFAEGWALYSEQLALEMGMYEGDPLGELGMLQAALFRAARLVVDTGLHAKRWSREKAIETMVAIDGSPVSSATTEIERYCVRPAQACSYMVGKLTWLRLREKAKAALGPRFDLRKFHDAVLLGGAMPLTVLEGVVDRHIAASKA
ncbi:DUF885 domain-containing protein [Phenylobacterium sp.]|uniref:DUF885 domain-containing protein n=1 Tax=Phenylobacterium sp. TaxID=1871053 RepID=UPI002F93C4A8